MISGTKAENVIAALVKIPINERISVTEIGLDMVFDMRVIGKKCFANTTRVTDRFHVKEIARETLREIKIKHSWEANDVENDVIKKRENKE